MRAAAPIGRILAALVLAGAAVAVVLALRGGSDGPSVVAEFSNARGLVAGNDVRIDGAPVGRVEKLELTDRGTARVRLRLNDGLPPLRADATASIRPVDLLGDTYVSLSPGHSRAPLRAAIPVSRTLNAPRLDDVLRVFQPPERTGLQATLVELGLALDRRGVDIDRAALAMRPALSAADRVMAELGSQNASLRSFVTDAERVTAQGAAQHRDLGRLVDALAGTLRTTADHAGSLDRGLQTLPATLRRVRSTSGRLAQTARAARPLAASLASGAGQLATAARRLGPFLTTTRRVAAELRPTLRLAATTLVNGEPTLSALDAGLRTATSAGPDLGRFGDVLVPAAPYISEGFFVNFPDQASEPGTQPFDPFTDARRNYWRGAGVMSCEAFGLKIEPGCLSKFLASKPAARPRSGGTSPRPARDAPAAAPSPGSGTPAAPAPAPSTGAPAAPTSQAAPAPPSSTRSLLDFLLDR